MDGGKTLNVLLQHGSNDCMLHRKLLKAPVRVLLLTFMLSARMTGATPVATVHISTAPIHASRVPAIARPRTRAEIPYSAIEGIQRWGLNE